MAMQTLVFDVMIISSVSIQLTLGQNLPLGSLGSTFLRHQVSQLVKEFLHFCASLTFSKLVADSQFGRAAVRLRSRAVFAHVIFLEVAKLLVLHGVMMYRREVRSRNASEFAAVFQSSLTGRKARFRGELAASNRLRNAAASRTVKGCLRSDSLNFFFRESPSLTLGRLGGSGNVASGRASDGGGGANSLWRLWVALSRRLISIGDSMNRKGIQSWARRPLLVEGVLDGASGLVVAGVRGVAESHVADALVNAAIHALATGPLPEAVDKSRSLQRAWSLKASIRTRAGRRYHGCDAHVLSTWGGEMVRESSGGRRWCLVKSRLIIGSARAETIDIERGSRSI